MEHEFITVDKFSKFYISVRTSTKEDNWEAIKFAIKFVAHSSATIICLGVKIKIKFGRAYLSVQNMSKTE